MALRPLRRAAEFLAPVDLEHQVPREFRQWRIDSGLIPVLPNPEVQAKLDKIYTHSCLLALMSTMPGAA